MIKNEIIKNIENIILSKQERKSRYISAINTFFENVYKAYKLNYCLDDDTIFNERIEDIVEDWMIPDTSFENQNLFLIKRLLINYFDENLRHIEFFKSVNVEDLFNVEIRFEPWDVNESWPYLAIDIKRNIFVKYFNDWYNSPIYVDEFGKVQLFDTFGDKRFEMDKDYFDKLDSAKLGTYLLDFSKTWNDINKVAEVVENDLNS